MNKKGTWYILKTTEDYCQIIESLDQTSTEDLKYWGPFPSREDAIAHRIGLIRIDLILIAS